MKRQPLGLLVLFVPTEIEPVQTLENRIDGGIGVAFDVGVVEPKDMVPPLRRA